MNVSSCWLTTTTTTTTMQVMTVELLLSALEACGVDNARIEVEGGHEIPVLDNSSLGWCIEVQVRGGARGGEVREGGQKRGGAGIRTLGLVESKFLTQKGQGRGEEGWCVCVCVKLGCCYWLACLVFPGLQAKEAAAAVPALLFFPASRVRHSCSCFLLLVCALMAVQPCRLLTVGLCRHLPPPHTTYTHIHTHTKDVVTISPCLPLSLIVVVLLVLLSPLQGAGLRPAPLRFTEEPPENMLPVAHRDVIMPSKAIAVRWL